MKDIRLDFEKEYSHYNDEFTGYLKNLIQIQSINGNKTYRSPFGVGTKRALDYLLQLSNELGFRTGQIGNCVGWAEYGPEDCDEYFGVLGHLDVVDVGDDWSYPPFDLTVKNGYFYGRGVLDNKGPILSVLLALYLIKQRHIPLKKRIRIMFGTDEESGSRDIPFYLDKQKPPYAGFTPDCKFPVVYGERGIIDLTVTMPITDNSLKQISSLSGEFNHSFIPGKASITLNGRKINFEGKKTPSNAPDMGDNVLPKLVKDCIELTGQTGDTFRWLNSKISDQYTGENLRLNYRDKESGQLQLSFYEIRKKEKEINFSISVRYPVSITENQIIKQLKSQILPEMTISINRSFPSVVKNKNLAFIQRFSKIYEEDTGLNGDPVTTTGATYAREMPNIVAFGPSFPGQKGIAHKGNEWLKINDWKMMMQIYYDCLKNELC